MATTSYTKKEHAEGTLLAASRIKKATLNVARGLSRVQAERIAAAAARNVNAYGQKEEGPSRWQERKEAKRQMYLMSTEKAVKLGVRKDNKSLREGLRAGLRCQQIQCQRCFEPGHWTFECKNERAYVSRPSHTQKLQNPSLRQPLLEVCDPLSSKNMEVDMKHTSTSTLSATFEESKGGKSKQSPRRKSDFRNRKRRRSKGSSSDSTSSESSPSKSDSESEVSSTSSEEVTSTTHSSSTMSSPSRTTSSSRKSSSCSSIDPPSPPESDSESRPVEGTMLTRSDELAKEESIHLEGTQSEDLSQPSTTSVLHCQAEEQESGMGKAVD